jgi:acyl-coenzyme A thioesterase PaaI-like protein
MNKYGKDFVKISFRVSVKDSFGKYVSSTLQNIDYSKFPEKVSYRYKIPPALCHEILRKDTNEKELQFSTSGILAVMDELSSIAVSLEDKQYRAGISVDLSVESLKPVSASEDVYLVTRTDKIGKTLGFCTMELTNLQGEILARGKHIKYLPMPFKLPIRMMLGFFLRTGAFGVFIYGYEKFMEKKFKTPLDKLFGVSSEPGPIAPEVFIPEHAFQILDLTVNQDPVVRKKLLDEAPDNHHCDISELYNMNVKKELKNPVGAMHGGAVAAAIEESSRLFKECQHKELEHILKMKSIEVRYLSPMTVSDFYF